MRKPSKKAVRVVTILSYLAGSLMEIERNHSDPVIQDKVRYATDRTLELARNWKVVTGSDYAFRLTLGKTMADIAKNLDKLWWYKASPRLNYPTLAYIGTQMMDDLLIVLPEGQKKRLVNDLHDVLEILVEYTDPEGEMMLTQERADLCVHAIYDAVGHP